MDEMTARFRTRIDGAMLLLEQAKSASWDHVGDVAIKSVRNAINILSMPLELAETDCKVQSGAIVFDGLVYIHPALRQYNGTWVVARRGGDQLIVSDGLGRTICESAVYKNE